MVLFQGNPKRYNNREVSLTWSQLIGECWRRWGKEQNQQQAWSREPFAYSESQTVRRAIRDPPAAELDLNQELISPGMNKEEEGGGEGEGGEEGEEGCI